MQTCPLFSGTPADTLSRYAMHTVDSVYIRRSHRRKGFAMSMIDDIIQTYPGEDIGFSKPISLSMCKGKFIIIFRILRRQHILSKNSQFFILLFLLKRKLYVNYDRKV